VAADALAAAAITAVRREDCGPRLRKLSLRRTDDTDRSVRDTRAASATPALEIEDDVVKAINVVRKPDKLRHLAPA
jgi:hypothetical protein